jgi:hypothetical protein
MRRKAGRKRMFLPACYYTCLAVAGFFIIGELHVKEPVYVLLGLFNLMIALLLKRHV